MAYLTQALNFVRQVPYELKHLSGSQIIIKNNIYEEEDFDVISSGFD